MNSDFSFIRGWLITPPNKHTFNTYNSTHPVTAPKTFPN